MSKCILQKVKGSDPTPQEAIHVKINGQSENIGTDVRSTSLEITPFVNVGQTLLSGNFL